MQFLQTRLLCGFMITTSFLSMWISNTATAAMILPIAHAVLQEISGGNKSQCDDTQQLCSNEQAYSDKLNSDSCLEDTAEVESGKVELSSKVVLEENSDNDSNLDEEINSGSELNVPMHGISPDDNYNTFVDSAKHKAKKRVRFQLPKQSYSDEKLQNDKSVKKLSKGLMLGIAYAANIGGTATLTGTGPNLILKGDIVKYVLIILPFIYVSYHLRCFPDIPNLINFGNWFVYGVPQMLLLLLFAWIYLSLLYCNSKYV